MAIAFDSASAALSQGNSVLTFSHTCSGSNRLLIVGISSDDGNLVSGVTYNGVAMTQIGSPLNTGFTEYIYLFYLVAPTSGSNNVAITGTGGHNFRAEALSYPGADQTAPIDSTNTGTVSAASSITVATTVVAANCWLVMWGKNDSVAIAAGAGSTARTPTTQANLFTDSNGTVSTGSQSQQFTFSSSKCAARVVSIAPLTGVATAPRRSLMGVGL